MSSAPGEKLSVRERVGYALGDVASNFFFQTSIVFLTFFYTDIFGISPAAVGTMFLVVRVWDMINDPIMGAIADRTRSRWGRFRPYLLWGALPFGLTFALTFTTPDLSPFAKLLYAYATYTAMLMVYTVVNVPYSALMGVMTADPTERTKLSTYRFVGAFAAGLAVQYLTLKMAFAFAGGAPALVAAANAFAPVPERAAPALAAAPGAAGEALRLEVANWSASRARLAEVADSSASNEFLARTQALRDAAGAVTPPLPGLVTAADALLAELRGLRARGFQAAMSVFAALSTVFILVAFAVSRERVQPLDERRRPVREDLASLRANRPFLLISALSVVLLTFIVMRGGATLYFFKYTLGAESALPTFLLVGSLCGIAGAASAPFFTRWLGKRTTLLWVFGTATVGMVLTFFVGPDDWVLFYALNVIGAFGGGVQSVMQWAIYADTADYGEYHTGHRNTGMVFASALFALKTGITVGGAVLGWYLAAINFVPDALPSAETAHGIRLLYTLIPAAMAAVCFGLMLAYPLRERDVLRIANELAARRSGAPA